MNSVIQWKDLCAKAWMVSNGISVVQINPYAVKQSKEIEVNQPIER